MILSSQEPKAASCVSLAPQYAGSVIAPCKLASRPIDDKQLQRTSTRLVSLCAEADQKPKLNDEATND